jgi:rhodanese-related sulfurtransferase
MDIERKELAMDGRQAKDALYEQFARIGKAVANPKRIELLDLLAQGEHCVDDLAQSADMGITNTSNHLQVLRHARLVETRKEGTRVLYRLADEGVLRLYVAIRDLAQMRLAEVDQVVRDYFLARDVLEPITREELVERAEHDRIIVLDVRPKHEYEAGHIPGAVSVPLEELQDRLASLHTRTEIVAYCRGPYCVLATEAIQLLRGGGFRARRLKDGMPEWRLAGLPVAVGREVHA